MSLSFRGPSEKLEKKVATVSKISDEFPCYLLINITNH